MPSLNQRRPKLKVSDRAAAEPTSSLPVQPAHQLPVQSAQNRWLVEALWSLSGVGLIGGEPKTNKSFLALDVAVSVASGTPCLRHFPVHHPGPVLLFAAEDSLQIVRQRLVGICAAAGVSLQNLDVQVITAPTVRLDLQLDCARLQRTVEQLKPRLLILDPFVRLHRIDENISGEVAPLLAYLRELQRHHDLSVMLVHHAKKGGGRIRAGQALRGSSEFHAWGDSNLYLRRSNQQLTLTVEHRAAPSLEPMELELAEHADALALQLLTRSAASTPAPESVDERIKRALAAAGRPMNPAELRERCHVRNATLHERLASLTGSGQLQRDVDGYRLCLSDAEGYCLTPPRGP
jgi:hypothetical protein